MGSPPPQAEFPPMIFTYLLKNSNKLKQKRKLKAELKM